MIFHPYTKFDQNRIIRCWVMPKTIFMILKMADDSRLEFWKFWILLKWLSFLSEFAFANQISSKSDNFHWDLTYCALTISKWRPYAILDFWNLQFMSRHFSVCHSASSCKNLLKSDDRLLSYVQKRFSRWVLIIFGHVTVTGFKIWHFSLRYDD